MNEFIKYLIDFCEKYHILLWIGLIVVFLVIIVFWLVAIMKNKKSIFLQPTKFETDISTSERTNEEVIEERIEENYEDNQNVHEVVEAELVEDVNDIIAADSTIKPLEDLPPAKKEEKKEITENLFVNYSSFASSKNLALMT